MMCRYVALKKILRIAAFVSLLSLIACLPIPQIRAELELPELRFLIDPAVVQSSYHVLDGYAEPNTPEELNKSLYKRFFVDETKPETIVVLMPGIYGGAGSLELIARELVASNSKLEVWAVDRRANLLEDRSIMIESVKRKDPFLAFDYYVKNVGTDLGFAPIPPKELSFMGFWGLEVHLRDLHEVILLAEQQAETIILGGHSLGAAISSFYAAFDFGYALPDLGFKHLDGLFLIDGVLGRTGGFDRAPNRFGLGAIEILPSLESLQQGTANPYLTVGLNPELFARRNVLNLLAHLAPSELAPEGLYDFPLTNLAAFGLSEDDQYALSTAFSSSWGDTVNAKFAGNLTAFILGGINALRSKSVVGPVEGAEFVDWKRGDPSIEYTDIELVAALIADQDTDSTEWYFPIRFALDIGSNDIRLEDAPGFVPNRLVTTPTLAVGASRGLVDEISDYSAYQNVRLGSAFSTYIISGFTHYDIVQNAYNPAVELFNLWLEQLN